MNLYLIAANAPVISLHYHSPGVMDIKNVSINEDSYHLDIQIIKFW